MYNEKEKTAFISTLEPSSVGNAKSMFNHLEPLEVKMGCDVALLPDEGLEHMLSLGLNAARKTTIIRLSTILKKYVRWRISNDLPANTNILKVRLDLSDVSPIILTKFVQSPEHLLNELDKYLPYDNECPNINCVFRTFLWLAYIGFDDEEAVLIERDDVYLDEMCIYHNYDEYTICEEAYNDIKNAKELKQLLYEHENPNYAVIRDRAESELLLIGFKPYFDMLLGLRQGVQKKLKGLGCSHLSYQNLYTSGVFYRVYQDELLGLPIDFSSEIVNRLKKKAPLGKKRDRRSERIAIKKADLHYRTDYNNWKKAFYAE